MIVFSFVFDYSNFIVFIDLYAASLLLLIKFITIWVYATDKFVCYCLYLLTTPFYLNFIIQEYVLGKFLKTSHIPTFIGEKLQIF